MERKYSRIKHGDQRPAHSGVPEGFCSRDCAPGACARLAQPCPLRRAAWKPSGLPSAGSSCGGLSCCPGPVPVSPGAEKQFLRCPPARAPLCSAAASVGSILFRCPLLVPRGALGALYSLQCLAKLPVSTLRTLCPGEAELLALIAPRFVSLPVTTPPHRNAHPKTGRRGQFLSPKSQTR